MTTVCPRSKDPFYVVTYSIKWVTTSWTDGICVQFLRIYEKTGQDRALKRNSGNTGLPEFWVKTLIAIGSFLL